MSNKYVIDILNEYEKQQDVDKSEQLNHKSEIYKKIPRIKDIDNLIERIGLDIAMSAFKGIDIESYISEKKKEITDLKVEKSELLSSRNYPVDYLDLKYKCSKCKDTGYIGNKKCSCFKQKLINKLYKQSNLKDILKKENFDMFDISLYSKEKFGNHSISPRKNMEEIFSYCINYVNRFDEIDDSLFFSGNPGIGKTFLSHCIAKDLLDKAKTVIYQTAPNLIELIRNIKFNDNLDNDLLNDFTDCDLLILDDLGTEQNNSFSQTELFNVINGRIIKNKKTIISTNILIEELDNYYPKRITSRILGLYHLYEFYGDDIRIKKNIAKRKSSL
jgi:DNA replication protein DnaC